MHLTKISGRAIKGGDFDIDLAQATILCGDNFAGKTRVADAIRLLLVGHLPELGKSARATFGLASGPAMEVRGTFSNGEQIWRRWFLKGDTVKTEQQIPPSMDGADQLLTVMLNAEEYFALSDQARVNYVFANCQLGEPMTIEAIAARILAVAPDYGFSKYLEIHDQDKPLQEWIEAAIAGVAEDWKTAKDNAKRMEETARGLTALRAQDGATRPVHTIEEEVTREELAMAELTDRLGRLRQRHLDMETAKVRRSAITRELAQVEQDRSNKKTIEEKLATISREIAASPAASPTVVDASANLSNLLGGKKVAIELHDMMRAKLRAAESALQKLDGETTCPYCGATGEAWKGLKAAELTTEIDSLQQSMVTARKSIDKFTADVAEATKVKEEAAAAGARIEGLKRQETTALADLNAINQRLARAQAIEEERDRLAANDPELTAQVQTIQTEITVRRDAARALANEIKATLGRANDLKRLADAEESRDKSLKQVEQTMAAGKELRKIQGELVEAAFAPMLQMANRIFGSVLPSALAYRAGEIGTWRAGQWIGHLTMSGTEKLITYAAIQAALAAKSPLRFMILDELGRLTAATAAVVWDAVHAAVANGTIDQFLGIDPERPSLYTAGDPGKVSCLVIPIG